jgi:hypothetical protein
MERARWAVCDPLVTWTEKVEVPDAVGMPAILPLADRLRPVGSDPEASDQA